MKKQVFILILILITVSALTYLPFSGRLGFYHDDWFTTISKISGVSLETMHAVDRPGMGLWYGWVAGWLGESPLAWQIFAWIGRTAGGIFLFFLILHLLPEQPGLPFLVTLFYLIYPGFLQQPSANNYQNHIFAYSAAILSIGLTIYSLQSRPVWQRVFAGLLALFLLYFYPRIYEAYIGLEILRLMLLGYLHWKQSLKWDRVILRTLLWYFPYLLILGHFLYWRLFVFESLRYGLDAEVLLESFRSAPLFNLIKILQTLLTDCWETLFAGWIVPAYQLGLNAAPAIFWSAIAIAGFSALLAGLALASLDRQTDSSGGGKWQKTFFWIGMISLPAALLPAILTGRDVQFRIFLDRYTYPALVSAAIFTASLVYVLPKPYFRKVLVGGLTFIGVFSHTLNAAGYADIWNLHRQFFWQVSWRAPQIERGSLIVAYLPAGYRFAEGQDVWAPLNRIFYPNPPGPSITAQVLNAETAREILAGQWKEREWRNVKHILKYDRVLVLSMPTPQSCVHVLDGRNLIFSPYEEDLVRRIAVVSNISLIKIKTEDDFHKPPQIIFGKEPPHEWCYYYQRADLALQQANWMSIRQIYGQTVQNGLKPADPLEWVPFIKAALELQDQSMLERISAELEEEVEFHSEVCALLNQSQPAAGFHFCERE